MLMPVIKYPVLQDYIYDIFKPFTEEIFGCLILIVPAKESHFWFSFFVPGCCAAIKLCLRSVPYVSSGRTLVQKNGCELLTMSCEPCCEHNFIDVSKLSLKLET